jgi:hypothetical protein
LLRVDIHFRFKNVWLLRVDGFARSENIQLLRVDEDFWSKNKRLFRDSGHVSTPQNLPLGRRISSPFAPGDRSLGTTKKDPQSTPNRRPPARRGARAIFGRKSATNS